MPESDHVEPLIPWYVNGTLEAVERAQVRRHVDGCPTCAELLRTAEHQASLRALERDAVNHPHPALLIEYVDEPGELPVEQREWIESKLAACESCRESVERLRETTPHRLERRATVDQTERPALGERIRAWLGGTLLQPIPAAAYLLALTVGGTWMLVQRAPGDSGQLAASPVRMAVVGERQLRATPDAVAPESLELPGDPAGVLLELETALNASDLELPGLAFRVELRRVGAPAGAAPEWSAPWPVSDFVQRGDVVSLSILVYPDRWSQDAVYELAVRAIKPGDPIDGQALFRRTLRVAD